MRMFLFVLLMVVISPLFLLGMPFYMIPVLLSRGKVSGTAYEPFNARLLYHLYGNRPDPVALQLSGALPATNRFVMMMMIKPPLWISRVTGYEPAMIQYPPPRPTPMSAMIGARCEFLDEAINDRVNAGNQVVILGAGWDTRAYGILSGKGATIFEVDAPATQTVKRRAIEKTGIDASRVTFVSCDFNRQSWLDALKECGFDPTIRTFILWEGVTMYLEEQAIIGTLEAVSMLPPGSCVAADFLSREWLRETKAGKAAVRSCKGTYGESLIFGFPVRPDFQKALSDYVEARGLSLTVSRPMGDETPGGLPFGGLFMAEVE